MNGNKCPYPGEIVYDDFRVTEYYHMKSSPKIHHWENQYEQNSQNTAHGLETLNANLMR